VKWWLVFYLQVFGLHVPVGVLVFSPCIL
jgi:hypothetical protein